MAATVNPNSAPAPVAVPTAPAQAASPSSSAGVSSAPTTLSSAAPAPEATPAAASAGCIAQIKAVVCKVVSCFASTVKAIICFIPHQVGRFCSCLFRKKEDATGGKAGDVENDKRAQVIRDAFAKSTPALKDLGAAIEAFKAIDNTAAQLASFQDVIKHANSSDEVALAFFEALPDQPRWNIETQMWEKNGKAGDGRDLARTAPRGNLMQEAVIHCITQFAVQNTAAAAPAAPAAAPAAASAAPAATATA
ncbi:MAG: hypothetical protein JSS61_03200 [Verrucomicrobia bacterium]|nr:hypothetical protein [Verrucomicrobiota bacterium]